MSRDSKVEIVNRIDGVELLLRLLSEQQGTLRMVNRRCLKMAVINNDTSYFLKTLKCPTCGL